MSFARLIALAIRNPLVTAASFVAVVMLFTTLIIVSYPDGGDEQALPVIEARSGDYKVSPDFESGMEIAHEDSTVFGAVRGADAAGGIENLLAGAESVEDVGLSKEELLAAQDADPEMSEKDLELLALLSEELKEPATPESSALSEEKTIEFLAPAPQKLAAVVEKPAVQQKTLEKTATAPVSKPKIKPVVVAKAKAPKDDTAQRLAALKTKVDAAAKPASVKPTPSSAVKTPAQGGIQISRVDPALGSGTAVPVSGAKANSARATGAESNGALDFVRSVLDQKDNKQAGDLNNIATASGTVGNTGAASLTRDRYVQLGSVRSAEGGESEWAKLQKQFSSELQAAPHRLSQVDLGEKGTFYRIQAGPFTAAQASAVCDSIKAQKPNGCLIVK